MSLSYVFLLVCIKSPICFLKDSNSSFKVFSVTEWLVVKSCYIFFICTFVVMSSLRQVISASKRSILSFNFVISFVIDVSSFILF